jgi:hypothetical protein
MPIKSPQVVCLKPYVHLFHMYHMSKLIGRHLRVKYFYILILMVRLESRGINPICCLFQSQFLLGTAWIGAE